MNKNRKYKKKEDNILIYEREDFLLSNPFWMAQLEKVLYSIAIKF